MAQPCPAALAAQASNTKSSVHKSLAILPELVHAVSDCCSL